MVKHNVLLVSLAFPPGNDSESLQVAKYVKYLLRTNRFHVDVITRLGESRGAPRDQSIADLANGTRQIVRVGYAANRYVRFLLRKLLPWMARKPDLEFAFVRKWAWAAQQLYCRPDVIYSRSFPISSTLMAYELSKHFNIPWILHLSDPWTISPIHSVKFAKNWNDRSELHCFEQASLLSFTSLETLKRYAVKYPQFEGKMVIYPNVYDEEGATYLPWEKSIKLKIVYTGGLVNKRNPISLIRAIELLQKTDPKIVDDLDISFAGQLDFETKKLFSKLEVPINHVGNLPFLKAMQLQASADILMLFDYDFKKSEDALFFPSKLLDYMLMRRRVLAITNTNSTSWRVMHDQRLGDCFTHQDVLGLANSLKSAWNAWNENRRDYFELPPADTAFAASTNALRLSEDLLGVCNEE
ncbi:hypothetical protein [Hydrogenophaga sp.]|uniref:hypothetical protein n=1 Tax=Hydrogenophaga sp. TaxID=1904254 RepID=UPI0027353D4E|nr:hypothetical protein [Hydrogenophaga sp.]MDP3884877.1 hypothetical protein [Hydrogenophaga sp.]